MCFDRRYGFRRNLPIEMSCLCDSLRISATNYIPTTPLKLRVESHTCCNAPTAFDTFCVLRTSNNVVPDTRQIKHSTTPYQHYRVLLKVMTLAGNVCRDFDVVGEANSRYFAKCRVRLLRRYRTNLQANTSLLRRAFLKLAGTAGKRVTNRAQSRCLRLLASPLSRFSYKLVQRRQRNLHLLGCNPPRFLTLNRLMKPQPRCNRLNVQSYKSHNLPSTKTRPLNHWETCFYAPVIS